MEQRLKFQYVPHTCAGDLENSTKVMNYFHGGLFSTYLEQRRSL